MYLYEGADLMYIFQILVYAKNPWLPNLFQQNSIDIHGAHAHRPYLDSIYDNLHLFGKFHCPQELQLQKFISIHQLANLTKILKYVDYNNFQ